MTREQHMRWCKDRALEIARGGDHVGAIASMCSDIQKHDETRMAGPTLGILMVAGNMDVGDLPRIERWIEGFN